MRIAKDRNIETVEAAARAGGVNLWIELPIGAERDRLVRYYHAALPLPDAAKTEVIARAHQAVFAIDAPEYANKRPLRVLAPGGLDELSAAMEAYALSRGGVLALENIIEFCAETLRAVGARMQVWGDETAPLLVVVASSCPCGRLRDTCTCSYTMRAQHGKQLQRVKAQLRVAFQEIKELMR